MTVWAGCRGFDMDGAVHAIRYGPFPWGMPFGSAPLSGCVHTGTEWNNVLKVEAEECVRCEAESAQVEVLRAVLRIKPLDENAFSVPFQQQGKVAGVCPERKIRDGHAARHRDKMRPDQDNKTGRRL